MRGDPISETLADPSAKEIADRKTEMWEHWQLANNMPAQIIVKRGYDLIRDRKTATIIVKSMVPRHMVWPEE